MTPLRSCSGTSPDSCHRLLLFGLLMCLLFQTPARAGDTIFADNFESGDVSAWTFAVGYLPPPEPFRISDLDLRDPHVFLEIDIGIPFCLDFTDDPLPVVDFSFNESLQTAITTDGDADGFLDQSSLLLFRPLELVGPAILELAGGQCTAPIETTMCAADPLVPSTLFDYDGIDQGTCLEALPGTTSGYSPAIDEPSLPCFVTLPQDLILDLQGLQVTLLDAQISATWVGDPVTELMTGLIRGFLRESDADQILLPPEIPVVGGQPLSLLLPGGSGNCALGDDLDLHKGETGWWFYLNATAQSVPFETFGPFRALEPIDPFRNWFRKVHE